MVAPNNKHHPLLAHGVVSVTGTKVVKVPGPGKIASVSLSQSASAASDVNKSPTLTHVVAADKKSFTIYAWKITAAGNAALIAATSAVNVRWSVIKE